VGLLGVLVLAADVDALLAIAASSNYVYLLLAVLVAFGDRILMAYKWNVLLRAKGIRIPFGTLLGTYLVSTFLGMFLPATVGGDALRAYAITKQGHSGADVVSSIVIERVLGFQALFVFGVVSTVASLFVFGQGFLANARDLFWLFFILLMGSVLLLYVSLRKNTVQRLSRALDRFKRRPLIAKWWPKLAAVYRSYQAYQGHRVQLGEFLVLSLLENLFPLIWTFLLALAFNIEVPLLYFFILVPIVLVLIRIPISFDGLGLQEGAFVFFLSQIGLPHSEALFLGLASHLIAIISVLPGGALYSYRGLVVRPEEAGRSVPPVS
jgi:uncharacterized protein (TIRG00374 family)